MSHTDCQKFGVTKLGQENYHLWKQKTKFLLARESLWSIVNSPPPASPNRAWYEKNEIALSTIGLLLSDKYLNDIRNITTAHAAWLEIKKLHERSSTGSRLVLYKKLFAARYILGQNMEEHILNIQETATRLEDTGHPVDQEVLSAVVLSSLPREFDPLVTALEGRDGDLTVGYIREKVIEEHAKLSRRTSDNKSAAKAMTIQESRPATSKSTGYMCYYCHKVGHVRKDCRLLKRHQAHSPLKPSSKYNNHKTNGPKVPVHELSKITMATLQDSDQDPIFGSTECGEAALYTENNNWAMTIYENKVTRGKGNWVVDSGAFAHLCHDKSILTDYKVLTKPVFMTPANGMKEEAIGKGNYCLYLSDKDHVEQRWVLKDVLYVPALCDNLISVAMLNSQGASVIFESGVSWMEIDKTRLKLGILEDHLYVHKVEQRLTPEKAMVCIHQWHTLLGHRNHIDIKTMADNGHTADMVITKCACSDLCSTCEITKMARKKFSERNNEIANKAFRQLYSDLCGPINPPSLGGNKFILSIIDDHSGYTKVYLLANKSDAAGKIIEYMESGTNRFGYRPLAIRTDNGGEYCNSELECYFKDKGIAHQKTVPYTPQENGTSERFNRTLLNCVRALLAQEKLPKYLWGEMANTGTYLNNIIKSK